LHPILVGSESERALCAEVRELSAGTAALLAGELSIPGLTALLSGCRALVTNDSGPGHVASAVGTPVVSVFGPTVPAFGYTPWGSRNRIVELTGLHCRPCHAHGPQVCPLGHHHCMTEIAPEQVLAALDSVLSAGQPAPGTP
jgi:heptosyltransferase-2